MEEKFERYPILEIEYNKDGTKKPFYILASEKDIKNMQIKSDQDEVENKYNMKKITKHEYEIEKEIIKEKSRKRTTVTSTTSGFGTGLREDDFENEVPVGGAIVFTLNVEDVDKF